MKFSTAGGVILIIAIRPSSAETFNFQTNKIIFKGRGGGLVVSVLAFYSDDPSSIPAEVYNFFCKILLKRTKINKKRPGLAHFLKKIK